MFQYRKILPLFLILSLAACLPADLGGWLPDAKTATAFPGPTPTPLPKRPEYNPGELVDYIAQTGDTLPSLEAHFNTTIEEIRAENPLIPADATTMPPGMPMKIPVYYLPFWGTPFKILPNSLYVNGKAAQGFDSGSFVSAYPGWLKDYQAYAGNATRSGAQIVDYVAANYSVSPRVLLAILEFQSGALTNPLTPDSSYFLGRVDYNYPGLYGQLIRAADTLNDGYYGWQTGRRTEFEHPDGKIERPDPWQNAATVAFQYYFSRLSTVDYETAIGPDGLARTYRDLFGDPWAADQPDNIPVYLQQPLLTFPFAVGQTWAFTSGPHTGWGSGEPLAALDFAPPAELSGCIPTQQLAIAMADGVVVRSQIGVVVLDLDEDSDERTGWNILYLHVATAGRASVGRKLKAGDPVGYPSCEGGISTGTHIHIARKYNGEWIPADGALPFNLEGWIAHNGDGPREGKLIRGSQTVFECNCSNAASQVEAGK